MLKFNVKHCDDFFYNSTHSLCVYMYLVYWPQPVPLEVILCFDRALVVFLAITGCISEVPFPSLWDIPLADLSTMFWSCCVIDTFLDISY